MYLRDFDADKIEQAELEVAVPAACLEFVRRLKGEMNAADIKAEIAGNYMHRILFIAGHDDDKTYKDLPLPVQRDCRVLTQKAARTTAASLEALALHVVSFAGGQADPFFKALHDIEMAKRQQEYTEKYPDRAPSGADIIFMNLCSCVEAYGNCSDDMIITPGTKMDEALLLRLTGQVMIHDIAHQQAEYMHYRLQGLPHAQALGESLYLRQSKKDDGPERETFGYIKTQYAAYKAAKPK